MVEECEMLDDSQKYSLVGGLLDSIQQCGEKDILDPHDPVNHALFILRDKVDNILQVKTYKEIKKAIKCLDEEDKNRLNSPLIDGLYNSILAQEKNSNWWDRQQTCLDLALHHAITGGYPKAIRYLIDRGASFNRNETTYLGSKNIEVIRCLLDEGVDIHLKDDIALIYAVEKGDINIITLLLDRGADIHANRECAMWAAADRNYLEVLEFLVKKGANIHANKEVALQSASSAGHNRIVSFLLDNGANVNIQKDNPLFLAVKNNHPETVILLLSRGAKITNANLLTIAIKEKLVPMITLLIERGVSVETRHLKQVIDMSKQGSNLDLVKLIAIHVR